MNTISKILSVFFLVLIFSFKINSQISNSSFTYLTIKEGLSQSTVEAILQDRKGYMWFATNDGLNRYDGYNFTVYRYDPYDTSLISDNYVYDLCEDDSGYLWIATNNGLNKFDPVKNKFIRFTNNPADSTSLSFNLVQTVIKDKDNNIWVGTLSGGINLLIQSSGKFYRFRQSNEKRKIFGSDMITSLCEDKNGNIWAGTYTGSILKLTVKKENIYKPVITGFNFKTGVESDVKENIVWHIKEDNSGNLWIATNRSGVIKFNPENETYLIYSVGHNKLNDSSVRRIFIDDNDNILLGTKTGGLNILNSNGEFSYIKSDETPGSLNDNSIWSIYKDRKGTLWIGTEFGGVNKFDPLRSKFEHYHSYSKNLRKERVLSFYEKDEDFFLIGTDGGLITFDYKRKIINDLPGNEGLQNKIITAVLEENKKIWIGTNGDGLYYINSASELNEKNSFKTLRKTLTNNNIKVIAKNKDGYLWIGTYGGGVDLFDPETEQVIYNLSEKGMKENFIYSLLEEENYLWIGTYGDGLIRYNISTEEIKKYYHNQNDIRSISNNRIYSLYSDENLWVGTAGGLNLFNKNDESFTAFTPKDGIANDVIYSIIKDDEDNFWVSTNRGISKFNFSGKTFKNYSPKDGLQDYEFNRGASLRSINNRLLFGGINGFNVFTPNDLVKNNYIPPVVITSFKKLNQEVEFSKAITEVDTIVLKYDENFFSFSFAALDYTDPASNHYAYIMEGFNHDWVYSGNNRIATYTNLDPGTYNFKVKAANNDGVWNNEGVSVTVIILPPFWQTWWFNTIIILSIMGILYLVYRIKLQRVIEIERLRTRIASDLHDDIGSNLTRIAMQSELILEDVNVSDFKKSIKDIGEKSREIISTMSDVVWSIDARNDSLSNLFDRMKEFSHDVLSRNNISVKFYSEGIEGNKKLPVDVRQNIYLIFKEAVNNIVKHSNASEVEIVLKNSDARFELRITDNGTIKKTKFESRKTGHGLRNMQMRSERINGSIEIRNEIGYEIIFSCKPL